METRFPCNDCCSIERTLNLEGYCSLCVGDQVRNNTDDSAALRSIADATFSEVEQQLRVVMDGENTFTIAEMLATNADVGDVYTALRDLLDSPASTVSLNLGAHGVTTFTLVKPPQ